MAIPNIREARKIALGGLVNTYTIACVHCRKPLWKVSDLAKYGTRWSKKIESYDGVPPYSEFWDKDQKTALKVDCPRCHEPYFKVLTGPNGIKVPKVLCFDSEGNEI
jgi:hypothetical protein